MALLSLNDTKAPDGTTAPPPNTTELPIPLWEPEVKIVAIVLYSIAISLSLVGNTLVIHTLRKNPETRRVTSFMYANLAIADLLVTVVVMPESLAIVLTGEKWINGLTGELLFKLVIFTFFVSLAASIFSLSAIAFDCFFSITRPMQPYPRFRNKNFIVPCIWISSMFLMWPWLIIVKVHEDSYISFEFSQLGKLQNVVRGVYLYIVIVIYILPLTTMCFLYGIVGNHLKSHTLPGVSIKHDKARHRANQTKRRVINMSVAIVVAFGFCWLPAHVYHTMLAIDVNVTNNYPAYMMLVCYWCGHANSAVNPWMLIYFKKRFRAAFRKMIVRQSFRKSSNSRTSIAWKSPTRPDNEIRLFSSSL